MRITPSRLIRPFVAVVLGGSCGCVLAFVPTLGKPPSPPVIAFIARTSGTNFTEDMRRGAQAAAQSAGYQIYWNAPTREDDVDRQIRIVQGAVERGARALILGPTNAWGVLTLVNELIARRLPIIFVQADPAEPTGAYLTSVTPDQDQFGRVAAERVAQVVGKSGQVAIVGVDRGIPETLARANSFLRAMAEYPEIRVVTETRGAVQTMEAEQSARELVSAFPDLKAIFAVSANATQGVMLALQDIDPRRTILLIGSDRDLFLAMNLHQGKLDSLVTVDGYRMGYLAVQAALVGIRDRSLPAPEKLPVRLLTRESLRRGDY